MKSNLYSLTKLFTDKIFRIPDFQRGYAWQEKHISDFWMDLINLKDDRYHYAGVITLEEVPHNIYKNWEDDFWIIKSKRYDPYFVVDGQQRLTTAIILLQALLESVPNNEKLNFTDIKKIKDRFIFESKDDGISRSYIFGYSNDDHSYEFLKTKIYGESADKILDRLETIYTTNLVYAKNFFSEKLENFSIEKKEKIFERLTQQFLFNVYAIDNDIDVCMAFETMNNRGRPLSQLELLKNRLIYLSTKIESNEEEKQKLRRAVNDSWKSIYHNLGKSKENPLHDDDFLKTHFFLYFPDEVEEKYSDDTAFYYPEYLLQYGRKLLSKIFIENRISPNADNVNHLTIEYLYNFSKNIGQSSELWWHIHNPTPSYFNQKEALTLQRINRAGIGDTAALILLFTKNEPSSEKRKLLYEKLELIKFYNSLNSRYYSYFGVQNKRGAKDYMPSFADTIIAYSRKKITSDEVITQINSISKRFQDDETWKKEIKLGFKSSGFYSWDGIRYFLYEYELSLKEKAKSSENKISWETINSITENNTIEHIYPQNARKQYWIDRFHGLSSQQRDSLRNSLGNLLPISRGKNSSLSNNSFPEKVDNGKNCGYRFGSYSEIDVSKEPEWTPNNILKRGLMLLDFMERRWNINLGTELEKIEILGLSFIKPQSTA